MEITFRAKARISNEAIEGLLDNIPLLDWVSSARCNKSNWSEALIDGSWIHIKTKDEEVEYSLHLRALLNGVSRYLEEIYTHKGPGAFEINKKTTSRIIQYALFTTIHYE